MERQIPSASSSGSLYSTKHTGVRRRSGKHSLDSNDSKTGCRSPIPSTSLYSAQGIDWLYAVDEDDSFRDRPTVVLVQNLSSSASHHVTSGPLLPLNLDHQSSPLPSTSSEQSLDHVDIRASSDDDMYGMTYSPAPGDDPIPVLLYPDVPVIQSTTRQDENVVSPISPVSMAGTDHSFLSIFTRRPTFRAFAKADQPPRITFAMVTPGDTPHSPWTGSNYSATTVVSPTSEESNLTNKPSMSRGESTYLIPSVNTTEKFTNKWPRPQSFRTLTASENGGINKQLIDPVDEPKLEEGQLAFSTYDPWNKHKIFLLVSSVTVLVYGAACLTIALMTWFRVWDMADVVTTTDYDLLILITLTGSLLIFASFIGIAGLLLHSRPLLAIYAIVLWPCFLSLASVGYVAYKRSTFALNHKLDLGWSRWYTAQGRLAIQNTLRCCGYHDALHGAAFSKQCYSRTTFPGCKGGLYRFEKRYLHAIWQAAFSLVPAHIVNILVPLLCANHITESFGEGIMPKRYHLRPVDVGADMKKIATSIQKLSSSTHKANAKE